MTYDNIVFAIVLALVTAFVIGAALAHDPHEEMLRLAWAKLVVLAYISDKIK